MKQVYIAKLSKGLGGPIKVFASDPAEAKKAVFSAYTFCSGMGHPNPSLDEVVVDVALDEKQSMDSVWEQPAVQVDDYVRPTAGEIFREQFARKEA